MFSALFRGRGGDTDIARPIAGEVSELLARLEAIGPLDDGWRATIEEYGYKAVEEAGNLSVDRWAAASFWHVGAQAVPLSHRARQVAGGAGVDALGPRLYTHCIAFECEGNVKTTVHKWGNSLGLRIPKAFAVEAQLESGSQVDLAVRDGELVVTPLRKPSYRLSDLLAQVTRANLHREVDDGGAAGREAL